MLEPQAQLVGVLDSTFWPIQPLDLVQDWGVYGSARHLQDWPLEGGAGLDAGEFLMKGVDILII